MQNNKFVVQNILYPFVDTLDFLGHMEKQETEMKRKLETEMGTKDAPITGAIFSLYSVLI